MTEAVWWEILLFILVCVGGYLKIFVAADKLIDNLCDAAKLWKIAPFLMGLLIIGIDPEEVIASIIAAIQNLPQIGIGNIIVNNIIAITLCFSIPMLSLSKKDLDALCNSKNIRATKYFKPNILSGCQYCPFKNATWRRTIESGQ